MNPDQYLSLAAKLARRIHTPEELDALTVFLETAERRHAEAFLHEYFRLINTLGAYPAVDPVFSARLSQLDLPSVSPATVVQTSATPVPTPPPKVPVSGIRLLRPHFLRYAVVALGVVALAAYLWRSGVSTPPDQTELAAAKAPLPILPGGDRAVLSLSDGSVILLDSASDGLLAEQGGSRIVKTADGQIRYNNGGPGSGELLMNTMSTPRGGQYRLTLPDGSVVWLNAASSLRFPASFAGKERRVWLTGEAYFEVNKLGSAQQGNTAGNNIPFIIEVNRPGSGPTEIEVLGTHFNVNAYEDEASIKTTLLEGKVGVSAGNEKLLLDPRQQVQVNATGSMKLVRDVDVEAATAWKNGYFSFNNTDVAALMRQISRWYDVEVEYADKLPERKFGGEISRNSNLSQVLKIMEESELSFRVEGKRIIVLPPGAAR